MASLYSSLTDPIYPLHYVILCFILSSFPIPSLRPLTTLLPHLLSDLSPQYSLLAHLSPSPPPVLSPSLISYLARSSPLCSLSPCALSPISSPTLFPLTYLSPTPLYALLAHLSPPSLIFPLISSFSSESPLASLLCHLSSLLSPLSSLISLLVAMPMFSWPNSIVITFHQTFLDNDLRCDEVVFYCTHTHVYIL